MKKKTLTKAERAGIIFSLCKAATESIIKDIQKEGTKLADLVYNNTTLSDGTTLRAFDMRVSKHFGKAAADCFEHCEAMRVSGFDLSDIRCEGRDGIRSTEMKTLFRSGNFRFSRRRPMPYTQRYSSRFDVPECCKKEAAALMNSIDQKIKEAGRIIDDITAVVHSAKDSAALIEFLPQAEKHIPDAEKAGTMLVPVEAAERARAALRGVK